LGYLCIQRVIPAVLVDVVVVHLEITPGFKGVAWDQHPQYMIRTPITKLERKKERIGSVFLPANHAQSVHTIPLKTLISEGWNRKKTESGSKLGGHHSL
jgi:hypothetical protein